MKTVKKLQIGVFLIFTLFILSGSHIQPTKGWKNGSYAYNPADYDYETDYGTHDWIADAMLDYLLELNASQWNWLNERREIYYVGTEAPDNSGVSFIADGTNLTGFGDTTLHHIYFYENGTVFENEDDAAIRAKWCADWADVSINEEKWDSAAFYLGALTHYIADMSMYAHVADNNVAPYYLNFDEHHSTIEGYVNTRTNEFDDPEEFFQLKVNASQIVPVPAYNATVALAWDTYADPTPSEAFSRGSVWLHEHFFSGWALTLSERSSETNATKIAYYNRIEENLNNAIATGVGIFLYIGQNLEETPNQPTDDDNSNTTSSDDDNSNSAASDDDSTGRKKFLSFPVGITLVEIAAITLILVKINAKKNHK